MATIGIKLAAAVTLVVGVVAGLWLLSHGILIAMDATSWSGWIFGIIFPVALVGIFVATRYLTNSLIIVPLRRLNSAMSAAEEGDFLVRLPAASKDELGQLSQNFNKLLARIIDLQSRSIDKNLELDEAQRALQARTTAISQKEEAETANTQLELRLKKLGLLYEITQTITSSTRLDKVLNSIVQKVGKLMDIDALAILLLDSKSQLLVVRASFGFPESSDITGLTCELGQGISGRVAQSGEKIYIPNTSLDPRYLHYYGRFKSEGTLLCLPIRFRNKTIGVLNFSRNEQDGFKNEEIEFLETVANHAAMAIDNAQAFEQIEELSITDELTQVFNRRHINKRVEHEFNRARRFQQPLSVIMIDIDHFKIYNDSHGHLVGDRALVKVADILKQNVRNIDTVGRFGGEEFIILLPQTAKAQAGDVAEKLRMAIDSEEFPYDQELPTQGITISAGVATLPDDAESAEALIAAGDEALFRAKHHGRNRVCQFIPDERGVSSSRLDRSVGT